MKEFSYVITDPNGLHARPAGVLAKSAAGYQSKVEFECTNTGKKADAKRLMAMMAMGVKCGMEVKVRVEGPDEDVAADAIQKFLAENF